MSNGIKPRGNSKKTVKLYVGAQSDLCSYNNMAKDFRLLDKKSNFCLYRKKFMQIGAFESP